VLVPQEGWHEAEEEEEEEEEGEAMKPRHRKKKTPLRHFGLSLSTGDRKILAELRYTQACLKVIAEKAGVQLPPRPVRAKTKSQHKPQLTWAQMCMFGKEGPIQ
jgi:hypothetical protein